MAAAHAKHAGSQLQTGGLPVDCALQLGQVRADSASWSMLHADAAHVPSTAPRYLASCRLRQVLSGMLWLCIQGMAAMHGQTLAPAHCWQHLCRSSGTAGATMTMLQSDKLPVTCMAWHPEGQLLATGSLAGPGIVVWQVALGTHHRIQAGQP